MSERDLALNRGRADGVTVGMRFKILSPEASEVRDPDTDEVLGTVEIAKVEVEVVSVQEHLSVCRTFKKVVVPGRPPTRGIGSAYSSLSESIFGDPGVPDRERFQTLRSDEAFVVNEINPEQSYIQRGDRAVQITN